jgi:type VI protein secretion system component VasK
MQRLTQALIQAHESGESLSQVLRSQAALMRQQAKAKRRRLTRAVWIAIAGIGLLLVLLLAWRYWSEITAEAPVPPPESSAAAESRLVPPAPS